MAAPPKNVPIPIELEASLELNIGLGANEIDFGELDLNTGFDVKTPSFSLCGFTFPPALDLAILLGINLKLPSIPIPNFLLLIGINCLNDNPIDVSSTTRWGGGRVASKVEDPDDGGT
jgi:hypothetical protein